jgi:hypothetical protein
MKLHDYTRRKKKKRDYVNFVVGDNGTILTNVEGGDRAVKLKLVIY